jgi:CBS domain-containing protein
MKRDLKVADLMTTAVITVRDRDSITHADSEMQVAGVRHLPVFDGRQHLVGILSDRDLRGALASARGRTVPVGEVMTRHVQTVTSRTPAREAAEIMLEQRIGSLPVLGEEGELIGLVTETDFLRLAHQLLG